MPNILYNLCGLFQDWEDGLTETDADGSFLHENRNSDLRLFSSGEDGAYHLLQVHTFCCMISNLAYLVLVKTM
jgi:hypothetical protein